MSIQDVKDLIQRLELELAECRAALKTLYGDAYANMEIKIIRVKGALDRARVRLDIEQYRAVQSNG